jgi:hypothetical protein
VVAAYAGHGMRVLWEAGASISGPRMQELGPDATILSKRLRDVLDVRPHLLAEVGHLVDEGYLHGEEGVGRVFDHLGRFQAGLDIGGLAQVQGSVDLLHDRSRALALAADHHAVGVRKVLHRRALAEEFRIRNDIEVDPRPAALELLLYPEANLAAGANRDGALVDDHAVAVHGVRDLAGSRLHVRKVGAPVVRWGRAHRDKNHLVTAHGAGEVGGKDEPSRFDVARHHIVQARLEYGYAAAQ